MRNYVKIIIVYCLSVVSVKALGQEVTFVSPLVEEGIRQHLNFAEEEQISFAQLDTITTLDLSKRGIIDISDLVLIPNLRTLDLSDNMVDDLQPLNVLESLEYVDLSYNRLKGINALFYSTAKDLTINIAFNYIEDFSLFVSLSSCNFTLEGAGLQMNENAPYYDVNYLYTIYNEEGKSVVAYRGYTNIEAANSINCGTMNTSAQLDGEDYTIELAETPTETTVVTLTNGEQSVTTYVVPVTEETVGAGKTITLETGLPEDYRLYSAYASMGTVEIDGTKMNYTAPETMAADVIYFSYYQGSTLKGFSRCYVNKVVGDLTGDAKVDDEDFTFVANCIMGKLTSETDKKKADINGDGEVNAADLVALANLKKYGKITPPNGTRKAETDVIGK